MKQEPITIQLTELPKFLGASSIDSNKGTTSKMARDDEIDLDMVSSSNIARTVIRESLDQNA